MCKILLNSTEITAYFQKRLMCKGVTEILSACKSPISSPHTPDFLSKWLIMEYMQKSLIRQNSGIKHYKYIYIQTCFVSYIQTKKC